ncbi:MAG TPA: NrsF family protein [Bryobacteraceae bacterium]|jgi:hypothetical protein
MKDEDIDDVLKQMGDAHPDVDAALLDSISTAIGSNLQPTEPIGAPWRLTVSLAALAAMLAIAIALVLGPHGVVKMDLEQGLSVFAVLGFSMLLSSTLLAAEAVPGSPRILPPWSVVASSCLALGVAFALLFHEQRTGGFVVAGMKCLVAGTVSAIPVALLSRRVLRQGFFVNRAEAGLTAGTLAGLAGVAMLEIHCPNFEAPHLLVWHIGVVLLSAALGAWVGSRR